jgi:hypothetical protein
LHSDFLLAIYAGVLAAGTLALGVRANPGFDGWQEAVDLGLETGFTNLVLEPVAKAAIVARVFPEFLRGEPAGGLKVLRAVDDDGRFAEELAVFGEEPFIERPGGGGAVGDAPWLIGAEGLAFGTGKDLGDGLLDGCRLVGGFDAPGDGAREGLRRDLTGVGETAGVGGIHIAGEEAVGDLGEDELDGGVIFEEGHDDAGALLRAFGIAVPAMGMAEGLAEDGGGVALEPVDAEGAAAAGREGGRWNFGSVVEVGGGGHFSSRSHERDQRTVRPENS